MCRERFECPDIPVGVLHVSEFPLSEEPVKVGQGGAQMLPWGGVFRHVQPAGDPEADPGHNGGITWCSP